MADQRLNRLKLLMKDREFDWPSQEELKSHRDQRAVKAESASSSQAARTESSSSAPSGKSLPDSFSLFSFTSSNTAPADFTMPKKVQSKQAGGKPPSKEVAIASSNNTMAQRQLGEMASVDISFCPIMAVSKYPYRFMSSHGPANKMLVDQVSQTLFAGGKFWQRPWTIYYIYPPPSDSSKPLLLVPASEVSTLLQEITDLTQKKAKFPSGHDRGFLVEFPDDGTPRPRYLGVCTSKNAFDAMDSRVPARDPNDNIPDRSLLAFKAKIEAATRATKNKNNAAKAKKKAGRINQKRSWCSQLRRTQRYLGLRPTRGPHDDSDQEVDETASPEDQHAAAERHQAEVTSKLPVINVDDFAPYDFEENVVFIALDVECWERSPRQVTEIGISTLDTNDIKNLSPGVGAKAWISCIKARHFRIKEHKHLTNTDFVDGCPDRFEKAFGESEFISTKEIPQVLASCFRPPFALSDSRNMPMGPLTDRERLAQGWGMEISDAQGIFLTDDPRTRPRKLVLVGHDISSDLGYLRSVGYDPSCLAALVEVLDTATLYQAWKQEDQMKSLGAVLGELDMVGWNLHNAGNDAAYTLQALLAMSLASLHTFSPSELETQVEAAKQEAEERVRGAFGEWKTAQNLGEVEATPEEKLKALAIGKAKRDSVDSANTKATQNSAAKTAGGTSNLSGASTIPTTVTFGEITAEQVYKPAVPTLVPSAGSKIPAVAPTDVPIVTSAVASTVEKSKPENQKSRYHAKKPKAAGVPANIAISKSLANLKASYADGTSVPATETKADKPKSKPKSKRTRKPKPATEHPDTGVVGDLADTTKFGTDRSNAANGVNANLSKLDTNDHDASNAVKPNDSKHDSSHWVGVSKKAPTASKGAVAGKSNNAHKPGPKKEHCENFHLWKYRNVKSGNVDQTAAKSKPNGDQSGPSNPWYGNPHSSHHYRGPKRRIGGIVREEYQFPPEIMRLPKHKRPMPPPGWRVPDFKPSDLPFPEAQYADGGVKAEDDDDAAYGIINLEEMEKGNGGGGAKKQQKGWIGDRPASWWREKTRRDKEDEDTSCESASEEDGEFEGEYDWEDMPIDGGAKEMEGEGENWSFMKDGKPAQDMYDWGMI